LNNAGTVQVQSGTISLGGGGALSGQLTVNAGSTLLLNGGNFVQSSSPAFSGAGVSQFLGSTLTLLSDVIPGLALNGGTVLLAPTFQGGSITNLTLTGSALNGTNAVSGTLNWNAGGMYGALTVSSSGVLNIGGGNALKQLLCPLTNAGSVVWPDNGQVQVVYSPPSYTGVIYNQASALFDLQGDNVLTRSTGNEAFNNAGTLRKSAGSGTSYCNLKLNNAGTVQVQSGTMSLGGGGALSGQFTANAGAALLLNSGNFVQTGNAIISGAGVSQFLGSALTLVSDDIPGLALNGGTVLLAPTFQGGSITNLTLTGSSLNGTNMVSGTLNWNAGALYGALTVNSSGVLNIGGATPSSSLFVR